MCEKKRLSEVNFKERSDTEDARVLVSHKIVIERSQRSIVVENRIFQEKSDYL